MAREQTPERKLLRKQQIRANEERADRLQKTMEQRDGDMHELGMGETKKIPLRPSQDTVPV